MKGLKEQKLAKKYNRRCGLSSLQTQSSLPVWIRRLKQVRKLEYAAFASGGTEFQSQIAEGKKEKLTCTLVMEHGTWSVNC